MTDADIEPNVERVARTLGIDELLARYPKELSGGQQQRVALGRAMVRDPKVFLLDEPLSNLDARLRVRMRRDLKELHQRLGSTIIYVTHDQAEAMSMSSRIAVFNEGRLQQYATPRDIYNRPANLFVANFVGDRELLTLDVDLGRCGGDIMLQGAGIAVRLSKPDHETRESATRDLPRSLTLGLRAEGLRLARPNDENAFTATVTQAELAGPDVIVYARTASGLEVCCRTAPGDQVLEGSDVLLAVVPQYAMTFDRDTGEAVPLANAQADT